MGTTRGSPGFRIALARGDARSRAAGGEGRRRADQIRHVKVTGAESKDAARTIAKSIANSPLVKTAIAGEDPNWGRIVAAVGKAGERADRDQLAIWLGDILVAKDGEVAPGYREAHGRRLYEGAGDRHYRRCRRGQGRRDRVDLRSHQRLYRH